MGFGLKSLFGSINKGIKKVGGGAVGTVNKAVKGVAKGVNKVAPPGLKKKKPVVGAIFGPSNSGAASGATMNKKTKREDY